MTTGGTRCIIAFQPGSAHHNIGVSVRRKRRMMADAMTDPQARRAMQIVAEGYERIAKRPEALSTAQK